MNIDELKKTVIDAQGDGISVEYSAEQIIRIIDEAYKLGQQSNKHEHICTDKCKWTFKRNEHDRDMETAEEVLTRHYMEKYSYSQDRITAMQEFKQIALDAMEEYADTKVKNLAQPDVSGSNCQHKNRTHVHHVGSYFEPKYGALYERCEDCGEKLNLIEYGDARGQTKWWQQKK